MWHLLTGLGASRIITGMTYLTLSAKYPSEFELGYTFGIFPYVRRVKFPDHASGNGAISATDEKMI